MIPLLISGDGFHAGVNCRPSIKEKKNEGPGALPVTRLSFEKLFLAGKKIIITRCGVDNLHKSPPFFIEWWRYGFSKTEAIVYLFFFPETNNYLITWANMRPFARLLLCVVPCHTSVRNRIDWLLDFKKQNFSLSIKKPKNAFSDSFVLSSISNLVSIRDFKKEPKDILHLDR